ncbi:MAG: hypothetical protein ABIR70_05810 [Bryobacteraceae bacterium]
MFQGVRANHLARECFLAWISVEDIYVVLSKIIHDPDTLDKIIKEAAYETFPARQKMLSIRRGRSYLRHQRREQVLKYMADRYPAPVSIGELCAVFGAHFSQSVKDFLRTYPKWFTRTQRGQYRLTDENIVEAVYQRVRDAQRTSEVIEYQEGVVKNIVFVGETEEDERFERYVQALPANSTVKQAHDAGVLEERLWAPWLSPEPMDVFDRAFGDFPAPPKDEFPEFGEWLRDSPANPTDTDDPDTLELILPTLTPEPILPTLTPEPIPEHKPTSVDSFFQRFDRPVKATDMYTQYVEWCRQASVENVSQTRFGAMVRTAGFSVKRTKTGNLYVRV